MSDGTSVMVGVRVRPYNQREKDLNAELCIRMNGPTTTIINLAEDSKETHFAFDESFWSHDNFWVDEKGYSHPNDGGNYADQKYVFDVFGKKVLDNAWGGYHCCLFAYGQTGSGKSYSMVGYGANKGIVPISCDEIFRRIADQKTDTKRFEVTVSMIEIYNEIVQDLSLPSEARTKKGLEIRENKLLGIYIDGVTKSAVDSYTAIEKFIDDATANRTVGATLMNATSSRAHTVLTIEFKQVTVIEGKETVKISMINLVDLAGSEKAGQTGATGDRLKEGSAINKSLSALGNVIEKLAARASMPPEKAKKLLIPYRDSKLTRLLQNALGGNSKTIMICALSPASSNYEETFSTLRYADRAKKIKNMAVLNENPEDKLFREIKEENDMLKDMWEKAQMSGQLEDLKAIADKQKELEEAQLALSDMQKSFQDKLAEVAFRREVDQTEQKSMQARQNICKQLASTIPHFRNLNEDKDLTGSVIVPFTEGKAVLFVKPGARSSDPECPTDDESSSESDGEGSSHSGSSSAGSGTVLLEGVEEFETFTLCAEDKNIFSHQAKVINRDGSVFLRAIGLAAKSTFVNGEPFDRVADRQARKIAYELELAQKRDADVYNFEQALNEEWDMELFKGIEDDVLADLAFAFRFDDEAAQHEVAIEDPMEFEMPESPSVGNPLASLFPDPISCSPSENEDKKPQPKGKQKAKAKGKAQGKAKAKGKAGKKAASAADQEEEEEDEEEAAAAEDQNNEDKKEKEEEPPTDYDSYHDGDSEEDDDESEGDLPEEVPLAHGDRVAFSSMFFVFLDPNVDDFPEKLLLDEDVTYENAKQELNRLRRKSMETKLKNLGHKGLGQLALLAGIEESDSEQSEAEEDIEYEDDKVWGFLFDLHRRHYEAEELCIGAKLEEARQIAKTKDADEDVIFRAKKLRQSAQLWQQSMQRTIKVEHDLIMKYKAVHQGAPQADCNKLELDALEAIVQEHKTGYHCLRIYRQLMQAQDTDCHNELLTNQISSFKGLQVAAMERLPTTQAKHIATNRRQECDSAHEKAAGGGGVDIDDLSAAKYKSILAHLKALHLAGVKDVSYFEQRLASMEFTAQDLLDRFGDESSELIDLRYSIESGKRVFEIIRGCADQLTRKAMDMQKVVDAEDRLTELTHSLKDCLVGGPEYNQLLQQIEQAKKDVAVKKFETREGQVPNDSGISWDPLGPEGILLQIAGSGDLKMTEEFIELLDGNTDPALQKAVVKMRRAHLIGNRAQVAKTAAMVSTAIHPGLGTEANVASNLFLERIGFEEAPRTSNF
eukprot:TRINITY_DN2586_c1_g3_i3.p1 TRINITY_DN2586_c1_g3~~TRINITY_DN2586_c1_g3_i3.p1  ORF type:complete len:1288 (+),score=398.93 TRINITY_DN2586_c1_g3_i3:147-4010(+)